MSVEQRRVDVRMAVLTALNQCADYQVPEQTLYQQVIIMTTPPAMHTEIAAAMQWLDAMQWIKGVRPALGGAPKWQITDLGRGQI